MASREVTLRDKRVRQPSWSRVFLAPSYSTGGSKHAYALQVLSEILGGGATSPLHHSIVVDKKLAVAAGTSYDPDNLGPSEFQFYASPRAGVAMATLAKAMAAEIRKVVTKGVTVKAVSRAKKRMQDAAIYARDSLRTGAYVLGGAITTGRRIEDVEEWPERIAEVTHAQVQAAAKAVLKDNQSVTAYLLPLRKPKAK